MKIALPFPRKQRKEAEKTPSRRERPRLIRLLVALVILAALAGGFLYWRAQSAPPPAQTAVAPVIKGDLVVTVESSGKVQPAKSIDLPFQTDGRVSEVFARAGEHVTAGQPLARLDARDLQLEVQQAEADLKTAQAGLDKASNGSATPQELAEARARLQAAQAELQKTRTGNITSADIRSAAATVQAAQARLDALKNPSPDKITAAQLDVTQAQTALQAARDDLSSSKTNAKLEMDQAVSQLTQAQSSYATAKQNWEYVQETGRDPVNPSTTGPNGNQVPNKVSDAQRQQYYDAFVKAEAALHSAESAVTQAQLAFDTARQKEVTGVQEAQTKVDDAQNQLNALMHPQSGDIAAAQADLAKAQAELDKLRQGGTRADVSAAQAQVDENAASLEGLTSPAAASDIAVAEANVAQAQAKLDAAKIKLANATVVAPFDGTIAATSVVPGSVVSPSEASFTIVDTSTVHLDISVGETDAPRVKAGQPVRISFDTLPDQFFDGKVTSVSLTAKEEQNVVTYLVQAQFDPKTDAVKLGMTADATIEVERHQNVIQAPNNAIQSNGPVKSVQVLYGESKTPVTVPVVTGATNGSLTEIVSCSDTKNMCLRPGDQLAINTAGADAAQGGSQDIPFGPPGPAIRRVEIRP